MTTNAGSKLSLKFMLLFIPAAYSSYLFHEFGHWIGGEAFGNRMFYALNNVSPQSGNFIEASHLQYSSIGGPAFTILLSLIFWLIIEKCSIAIIVLLFLFLIVVRASYLLRINLQKNSYVFTVSTLCNLLVIGASKLIA